MGLDMYLTRKLYLGASYEHNKITGKIETYKDGKLLDIDLSKIDEIEQRAGYWRKANAIHNWFVANVQDGMDDCDEYYVSKADLQSLLDTVNDVLSKIKMKKGRLHSGTRWEGGVKTELYEQGKVIKNPEVCEALPTTSGFFFGSTDYNEWYVDSLKETKAILEESLDPKYDNFSFYYHSSW